MCTCSVPPSSPSPSYLPQAFKYLVTRYDEMSASIGPVHNGRLASQDPSIVRLKSGIPNHILVLSRPAKPEPGWKLQA